MKIITLINYAGKDYLIITGTNKRVNGGYVTSIDWDKEIKSSNGDKALKAHKKAISIVIK